MAKKTRLKKDYTNWWSVAGDLIGGTDGLSTQQAQRYYAQLKALNPGVTRFTRGMSIRLPSNISAKRPPVLSDNQVAAERRQFDYSTGRPTQDYYNAVQSSRAGSFAPQPQAQQPMTQAPQGQTPQRPIYGTSLAPQGFEGLPPVRQSGKYSPARRAELIARRRIVPPIQQDYTNYKLPQEQYEYFYGDNPRRAAEERNRLQREQERAAVNLRRQQQANNLLDPRYDPRRNRSYTPPAPQFADVAAEDRRFRQGQYGAQYDRPSQAAPTPAQRPLTGQEALVQQEIDYQNQFYYDTYGADVGSTMLSPRSQQLNQRENQLRKKPTREVANRIAITPQVQAPYTTDWLDSWLENNNVDLSDPNSIAMLNDATQYMLMVVNAIEPVEFATSYGSGYGSGYGSSWYGGGGGGGGYGGYGGGGNYNQGAYPEQDRGRRYAEGMGLVSWRI